MDEIKTPGQVGYEAYGDTALPEPWKTYDGKPMPTWAQLQAGTSDTCRRWEVSAAAILSTADQQFAMASEAFRLERVRADGLQARIETLEAGQG